jgi:hypothetical protein
VRSKWFVRFRGQPPRWLIALAAVAAAMLLATQISHFENKPLQDEVVSVPPIDDDIETRLTEALREPPDRFHWEIQPWDISRDRHKLASAIAGRMKNYPAVYSRPGTLMLGESTAVQLVVKTNENQEIDPYFTDWEGELRYATVRVASDVSAQLTGPPDRLQITLRGDKMRTILSPE